LEWLFTSELTIFLADIRITCPLSQFHFVQLGEQLELPGEITAKQQVVVPFDHVTMRGICT
jgi:hypothetical protein